jgi:AbrB family looped-hinge helix DNA binding protein
MRRVRLSSKGRIVIPAEVRSQLGLKRGSLLTVRLEGEKVVIELWGSLPRRSSSRRGKKLWTGL